MLRMNRIVIGACAAAVIAAATASAQAHETRILAGSTAVVPAPVVTTNARLLNSPRVTVLEAPMVTSDFALAAPMTGDVAVVEQPVIATQPLVSGDVTIVETPVVASRPLIRPHVAVVETPVVIDPLPLRRSFAVSHDSVLMGDNTAVSLSPEEQMVPGTPDMGR